ncbi:MAG TPA: PilZ domain-containing protein [Planctomycetota bacterium]|nr:PilZ domain-containing protein [Planctomycetota bacterium]
MPFFYESEKREFVRVGVAVPVKFRLISQSPDVTAPDDYMDGETQNIGAGGMLLVGPIPQSDLITGLLVQKVVVGVRIYLPGEDDPVEALARVAWLESLDQNDNRCSLGLSFKEITSEAQDTLFRFIISSRMG